MKPRRSWRASGRHRGGAGSVRGAGSLPVRRSPHWLLALLLVGCATPPPGGPSGDPSSPRTSAETVACYEADRDLVSRVPAALCRGRIVDAREAVELEAARSLRVQAAARRFGIGEATERRAFVGSGTGILIGPEGEVLTSFHVVRHCPIVSVTSTDGTNAPARIRAKDQENDLVVLSTRLKDRPTAVFNDDPDSASPFRLAVIGFPLQKTPTLLSSLTPALARPQDLASEAQQFLVGGTIRPGHSGSPLVDQNGNVVGLVKAKIDSVEFYQRTGRFVDDIGLAISNATILEFLAAHDIPFRAAPSSATLSDEDILATSRRFVVRVNCWR